MVNLVMEPRELTSELVGGEWLWSLGEDGDVQEEGWAAKFHRQYARDHRVSGNESVPDQGLYICLWPSKLAHRGRRELDMGEGGDELGAV